MTIERLRDVLAAKPFRRFVLELADGNRVPVINPDYVLVTPGGRTIVVTNLDDSLRIIDLLLVASIHISARRNGVMRRRRRS